MTEAYKKDISEIGRDFSMALHSQLKKFAKAHIFAVVNKDDVLIVEITQGEIKFKYDEKDVLDKIVNGYTSKNAFDKISRMYKAYVNHKYFYPVERGKS